MSDIASRTYIISKDKKKYSVRYNQKPFALLLYHFQQSNQSRYSSRTAYFLEPFFNNLLINFCGTFSFHLCRQLREDFLINCGPGIETLLVRPRHDIDEGFLNGFLCLAK